MPIIRLLEDETSEPNVHNPATVAPLSMLLGMVLMAMGSLGLTYMSSEFASQARFFQHPHAPTLADAGQMMIAPGFIGGALALAFGVYLSIHYKNQSPPD